MRRLGLSFAAIAVALAVFVSEAGACTCASTGSRFEDAKDALRGADAAFTGVLKSVEPVPRPAEADFRYRVRRDLEGGLGDSVRVRSTVVGGSCGLPTREGRKYGLVIYGRPQHWKSGLCSVFRARTLRRASEAVGKTGSPAAVSRGRASCPGSSAPSDRRSA